MIFCHYLSLKCLNNNNNRNNTLPLSMFMVLLSWRCHCETSPSLFGECRTVAGGCWSSDLANWCGPQVNYSLYPPPPFIIRQPESWYLFYRPTESRRLSTWVAGYILTWFTYLQTVIHLSANWAQHRATTVYPQKQSQLQCLKKNWMAMINMT